jgi:hypothetical protein
MKLYTFHFLRMLLNWYKYGYYQSKKKGTLLEYMVPFSQHLAFYSRDLNETVKFHLLRMRHIWYKYSSDR